MPRYVFIERAKLSMTLVQRTTRSSCSSDLTDMLLNRNNRLWQGLFEMLHRTTSITASLLWLIVTFLSKCRFCSIRPDLGFDAQHVKNLHFVTILQIGFSHLGGPPRSCSDQTFCKGPVSNYSMTLWTGLFGLDTQLTLLIYCLVYGPLKLAFWTPKTWLFGQNGSLDPIFGGTQIWTPQNRHFDQWNRLYDFIAK